MEWGITSTGGHVIVYGLDSLVGWEAGQYQIFVPQTSYTGTGGLFDIINRHGQNAFATLAHPNNSDFNGIMTTYNSIANNAIVGSAVENGPSTSTNTTYTDYPSSMLYLSYYRNMLAKGYHIGPTLDHDNHNVTHGHTALSRTVVLSPSLSEADILSSMRLMRFYATEDCSAIVTFKINNQPLGSILTKPGAPSITVTTSTGSAVTSLKLYSGVPGSGSNATILTSVATGSLTYTHAALSNGSTRYYYVDITTADGKRTVTAPIWYTRDDSAPAIMASNTTTQDATVSEFFPIIEEGRTILKWVTQHEAESTHFILERSDDDKTYTVINTQEGLGDSPFPTYYSFDDFTSCTAKTMYYRLTQTDGDGRIFYRHVAPVLNNGVSSSSVVVYPNPFNEQLNLRITHPFEEQAQIDLYDLSGHIVLSETILLHSGEQTIALPTSNLTSGFYILRMINGEQTSYRKIIHQ